MGLVLNMFYSFNIKIKTNLTFYYEMLKLINCKCNSL